MPQTTQSEQFLESIDSDFKSLLLMKESTFGGVDQRQRILALRGHMT